MTSVPIRRGAGFRKSISKLFLPLHDEIVEGGSEFSNRREIVRVNAILGVRGPNSAVDFCSIPAVPGRAFAWRARSAFRRAADKPRNAVRVGGDNQ